MEDDELVDEGDELDTQEFAGQTADSGSNAEDYEEENIITH